MPFGPEISWPYGFRQLDPRVPGRARVGLRHRPRVPAARHGRLRLRRPGVRGPVLRRPEDPVADPSVRPAVSRAGRRLPAAPRVPSAGTAATGHQVPSRVPGTRYRGPPSPSARVYPVPGSQEALRLPAAADSRRRPARPGDLAGDRRPRRHCRHRARTTGLDDARATSAPGRSRRRRGTVAPGRPRLDECALDGPRLDGPRLDDVRRHAPADPRLEGMNYGELRYDEPDPG